MPAAARYRLEGAREVTLIVESVRQVLQGLPFRPAISDAARDFQRTLVDGLRPGVCRPLTRIGSAAREGFHETAVDEFFVGFEQFLAGLLGRCFHDCCSEIVCGRAFPEQLPASRLLHVHQAHDQTRAVRRHDALLIGGRADAHGSNPNACAVGRARRAENRNLRILIVAGVEDELQHRRRWSLRRAAPHLDVAGNVFLFLRLEIPVHSGIELRLDLDLRRCEGRRLSQEGSAAERDDRHDGSNDG